MVLLVLIAPYDSWLGGARTSSVCEYVNTHVQAAPNSVESPDYVAVQMAWNLGRT